MTFLPNMINSSREDNQLQHVGGRNCGCDPLTRPHSSKQFLSGSKSCYVITEIQTQRINVFTRYGTKIQGVSGELKQLQRAGLYKWGCTSLMRSKGRNDARRGINVFTTTPTWWYKLVARSKTGGFLLLRELEPRR